MISLFEKLQYVFSGLILLMVVLLYYLLGGLETQSKDLLPDMELIDRTSSTRVANADTRPSAASGASPRSPISRVEPKVVRNLERQGLPRTVASNVTKETRRVPEPTFRYISKPRNWVSELEKAASTPISGKDGEPSMLRIHDIESGSLFEKFGIQDGDTVALIDGEVPLFDASRSQDYVQTARRLLSKFEAGETISVTVLRGGKPVHLEFKR